MTNKIFLFLLFCIIACSHQKLAEETTVPGNCADKIKEITPPSGQTVIDLSKQVTAGTASIAIAGVGVATDSLVIVLTHPVTKFTLCVATIAAATQGHGPNDASICQHVASPHYNPKLTQKALDNTRSWRCPNLDYVSEGLRNVASCYANRQEKEKARQQLQSILNTKGIVRCLSDEETDLVKTQLQTL